MSAPTAKYSVSMPRDVAEEARLRGGPSGLSAYVTAAVSRSLQADRLREIIETAEAEHGPITVEEIDHKRRLLREAHDSSLRKTG